MTVLFVAGNLSGAFYGLAPVYAAKFGMTTSQAAVFVTAGVTAGLLSQWPMGWLSDRINRAGLIRFNAFLLVLLPVVMRSEEHPSELQSLMRNSYDVFFLKKKNKTKYN